MLAVPFQGYAAASMALCMPGQHGSTSAMSDSMSGPETVRDHDAGHVHHAEIPKAAHDHSHPSSSDGGSVHKCGTCGACHAVAMIAAIATPAAHMLPPVGIAETTVAIAEVAPRVPDKPPRA